MGINNDNLLAKVKRGAEAALKEDLPSKKLAAEGIRDFDRFLKLAEHTNQGVVVFVVLSCGCFSIALSFAIIYYFAHVAKRFAKFLEKEQKKLVKRVDNREQ